LHVVCDGQGRPLIMLLSDGQMSDYTKVRPSCSRPCRAPRNSSATKDMTPTGFDTLSPSEA
jgi:hypothetical protein